ncbi:MAG TPA: cell division protein FtsX [Bacteroidales bacterium]|nr:cell division protein FtsX [Bacteroidales bacterium]
MIKNLIKHSVRALNRQKGYVFINIIGLSIGIACSLLISLFVINELSYDQFNLNKDRIYRVNLHGKIGGTEAHVSSTASPVGPTMMREFPEVENFTRYNTSGTTVIKYNDQSFTEEAFVQVDSSFFSIFSIPLLKGDKNKVLNEPHTVVISQTASKKYFGSTDPIDKMLKVGTDSILYRITGVMEDIPENSSFKANMFGSFLSSRRANDEQWLSNSFETYVLLKEGTSPDDVNKKFIPMLQKYVGPLLEQYLGVTLDEFFEKGNQYNYQLQPLLKIHLDPGIQHEVKPSSDPKYLYIFGSIAILIIIIAAINFMNLSTAQAAKRAKEVGIKKVSGSTRGMLIRQFLTESILLSLFSLILSIVIIELSFPFFNNILNSHLELDYFGNWYTVPGLITISLLVGLLAGSYPAFYLSAFKPVSVLKGSIKDSIKNGKLRSVLVILQFSISIILIVGTLIIFKQINFMINKDLGFDKEQLVVLSRAEVLGNKVKSFKEELLKINGIKNVSTSTAAPMHNNNGNGYSIEGRDQESFLLETNWVDYDYFETYGIELSSGRLFNESYPTDQEACIVNENAVKSFNLTDPFATRFIVPEDDLEAEPSYMPIIGVVKDFHFRSLHYKMEPSMLRFKNDQILWGYISIKLKDEAPVNTLKEIEKVWNEFTANEPIQYFFMDNELKQLYIEEQQNAKLSVVFTILAIVIASLGLFGLTSFTVQQRTKEIGIRKALGASVGNVFYIISKEIIVLVTISTVIAWPIIYFIAKNWLQNYQYKINLNIFDFLIGFVIALTIAVLTITYRTLRAARLNPALSLRYE